ncbi:MAG: tetratricopeptide repeat protein [Candidatus Hydrogenedentota bacterium]
MKFYRFFCFILIYLIIVTISYAGSEKREPFFKIRKKNPEEYLLKGYYLELSDSIANAIIEYKKYAKNVSWDTTILNRIAYLYLKEGDIKAFLKYSKYTRGLPYHNDLYHFLLGNYYIEDGDVDKAIASFQKSLQYNPGNLESKYYLGSLFLFKNDYDTALNYFKEILSDNPEHLLSLFSIGEIYTKQKDYIKAISVYKKMLVYYPYNTSIIYLLGLLYKEMSEYNKAIEYLKQVIEIDSSNILAHFNLAELYSKTGDSINSKKTWGTVINNVWSFKDLFLVYNKLSEIQDTGLLLMVLNKINSLYKDIPLILAELGRVYTLTGDFERAVECFDRTIKLDYFDSNILILNGLMKVTLNKYKEAIVDLKESLKYDMPEKGLLGKIAVYKNLAFSYDRIKEYQKSAYYFEKLINMGISSPDSLNYVAYTLALKNKELDKAYDYVMIALDKEPENPFYLDTLGWILYKKGNIKEALSIIIKAASLRENDPDILEHLGIIYWDMRDYDTALRYFKKTLEIDPKRDISGSYLSKFKVKTNLFH